MTYLHSRESLDELVDVLARPWLAEKYGVRNVDAEALVKLLLLRGEGVVPEQALRVCRDPRDDKFLALAVAGRADFLVSGDGDLRELDPFRGVRIVSPAEFLSQLGRR